MVADSQCEASKRSIDEDSLFDVAFHALACLACLPAKLKTETAH